MMERHLCTLQQQEVNAQNEFLSIYPKLLLFFEGHILVLKWLIAHGAKVERDDLGGTALHDAAEHGQLEVSKWMKNR